MTRVLAVLRYYPALTETFVARELAGLAARGVHVEVASLGERPDSAWVDPVPGIPVHRRPGAVGTALALPEALVRGTPALGDLLRWQGPKAAARAARLARIARRSGITRVHAHFAGEAAEVARAVAAVLGVPWSVTAHAVDLFKPRPSLDLLLADADPVITVCAHHRDWIRERCGVHARIVRCGVPVHGPLASPGDPGPLRLVTVARDVPKKGLDVLFEALESLPDAQLRLVSDSSRRHPRATVGPLPPADVPAALAAAHAFVLPCRVADDGDMDGIPVALLEAMAAGLPVITTPVAGIPEVVDEGVGWWVPPDDAPALARTLRAAADDRDARRERGGAARRRIAERGHLVDDQVDGVLGAWGVLPPA